MSPPAVSLLIPFASNDPIRKEIATWVMTRWIAHFPQFQYCIGEDDPDDFNRSRARNAAFQQADGDIIIISDADTVSPDYNVYQAMQIVKDTNAWVIAHTMYYSLTQEYTNQILQYDPQTYQIEARPYSYDWKMHCRSEAGVLVMPREAYETVEGYDERFNGWGYEDSAFAVKLNHMWGDARRVDGDVFHLWHPRGLDFEQPHIKFNEDLYREIRNG